MDMFERMADSHAEGEPPNIASAAFGGDVNAVRKALAAGADVNFKAVGGTPLHIAAAKGHREIVDALIAAGADVNPAEIVPPLAHAVGNGHTEIVLALLRAGADPNVPKSYPPLFTAATKGMSVLIQALIERGASPNATVNLLDSKLRTSLMAAAEHGHLEATRVLLGSGADVNRRDGSGLTAREWAEKNGHAAIVALLKEAEERAPESLPQQLLRAARDGNISALEAALKAGAAPDDNGGLESGFTPLMFAVKAGNEAAVAALLSAGAAANLSTDPTGADRELARGSYRNGGEKWAGNHRWARTPLMLAAEKGNVDILRQLLRAGANANLADHFGFTALMLAVRGGSLPCVVELLNSRANVHAATLDKVTVLHLAAGQGDNETLTALLKAGARCDAEDKNGYTPLARVVGRVDLPATQLLLNAFRAEHPALTKSDRKSLGKLIHAVSRATRKFPVNANDPAHPDAKSREYQSATKQHYEQRLVSDEEVVAVVASLLAAGADVEAQDRHKTPLMRAAYDGRTALIAQLLDAGAKINVQSHTGETALRCAIDGYRLPAVVLLLERGADPNLPDDAGITPLAQAQNWRTGKECRALLERHGAKLDVGETPRMLAERAKEEKRRQQKRAKNMEKWGPDTPRPDLSAAAASPEFQAAAVELAELFGNRATPAPDYPAVVTVNLHSTKKVNLQELHDTFLKRGYYLYSVDAVNGATCALAATADRYVVVAAMQTNGQNYDVGPGGIIAWLKNLEAEQPFVLLGIGHDFVSGKFLKPVKKAAALAKSIHKFCPDVVEGPEEVPALADQLKQSRSFTLWWD